MKASQAKKKALRNSVAATAPAAMTDAAAAAHSTMQGPDGAIDHLEGDVLVRRTYAEGHEFHGRNLHFEGGVHVRTTFSEGQQRHGEIWHYEGDALVRMTYEEGHAMHGRIDHFDERVAFVRRTAVEGHERHGLIDHFDPESGKFVRRTYAEGHKNHGDIDHYEGDTLVRTTYEESHDRHGEIHHIENGVLVRVTYAEGHEMHGESHVPRHLIQVPRHPLGMQRKIINPAWFPWERALRQQASRDTFDEYQRALHGDGAPPKYVPLAEVHATYFEEGSTVSAIGTPLLRNLGDETGRCEGEDWPDDADSPARGKILEIKVVGDDVHCYVQLTILRGLRHEGWLSASLLFPPFYSDACLGACYEDHVKELGFFEPYEVNQHTLHVLGKTNTEWCDQYPECIEEILAEHQGKKQKK